MKYWDIINIRNNEYYRWQINDLNFWLYRDNSEWIIGYKYKKNQKNELIYNRIDKKPKNAEWVQILANTDSNNIQIAPGQPDLPIMIKSKRYLYIMPGNSITYYIKIPVYIHINSMQKNNSLNLFSINSKKISKTWFGDPTSKKGILSYSSEAILEKDLLKIDYNYGMIICPLKIINKSNNKFNFSALNIQTQFLSVYEMNDFLMSETIVYNIKKNSKIDINIKNNSFNKKDSTLLSKPREKFNKNMLEKILLL